MIPRTHTGHVHVQAFLVGTTIGALIFLAMYLYHKRKKTAIPSEWEPVGEVRRLCMYPLKSGHRMELTTALCTEYGFQIKAESVPYLRDRCLVVYKENNKEFKTARTYPKLLLVSVTVDNKGYFSLTAPGMEKLLVKVPRAEEDYKTDQVVMWENEKVFTIDCGDDASRWFSHYILEMPTGLRLGFHNGLYKRDITKTHGEYFKIYSKLKSGTTGMYSDLSSFLLMNQASVNELNSRIPDSNITMNNFRPNIVVEGDKIAPYSEDKWDWVKIGEVVLRNVKPCTRCSMTTINPETGVKSANNEPLKTLKKYRKLKDLAQIKLEGDSPVLGINMSLEMGGEISVGDKVYLGRN